MLHDLLNSRLMKMCGISSHPEVSLTSTYTTACSSVACTSSSSSIDTSHNDGEIGEGAVENARLGGYQRDVSTCEDGVETGVDGMVCGSVTGTVVVGGGGGLEEGLPSGVISTDSNTRVGLAVMSNEAVSTCAGLRASASLTSASPSGGSVTSMVTNGGEVGGGAVSISVLGYQNRDLAVNEPDADSSIDPGLNQAGVVITEMVPVIINSSEGDGELELLEPCGRCGSPYHSQECGGAADSIPNGVVSESVGVSGGGGSCEVNGMGDVSPLIVDSTTIEPLGALADQTAHHEHAVEIAANVGGYMKEGELYVALQEPFAYVNDDDGISLSDSELIDADSLSDYPKDGGDLNKRLPMNITMEEEDDDTYIVPAVDSDAAIDSGASTPLLDEKREVFADSQTNGVEGIIRSRTPLFDELETYSDESSSSDEAEDYEASALHRNPLDRCILTRPLRVVLKRLSEAEIQKWAPSRPSVICPNKAIVRPMDSGNKRDLDLDSEGESIDSGDTWEIPMTGCNSVPREDGSGDFFEGILDELIDELAGETVSELKADTGKEPLILDTRVDTVSTDERLMAIPALSSDQTHNESSTLGEAMSVVMPRPRDDLDVDEEPSSRMPKEGEVQALVDDRCGSPRGEVGSAEVHQENLLAFSSLVSEANSAIPNSAAGDNSRLSFLTGTTALGELVDRIDGVAAQLKMVCRHFLSCPHAEWDRFNAVTNPYVPMELD